MSDNKLKTNIEQWYEVIKKVIKMWESSQGSSKTSEADDFYVFMYDEDENTQKAKLKKASWVQDS